MNGFIIGRLGAVSLLAALLAVGCALEQSTSGGDESSGSGDDGSSSVHVGTTADEQISAGEEFVKHSSKTTSKAPDNALCPSCGPLPDPWAMGPLPDPWTSSSSSSSGNGGSSGEGSTSGGTKTGK